MDGWMDRSIDNILIDVHKWINGWMVGSKDGQKNGWMDGLDG